MTAPQGFQPQPPQDDYMQNSPQQQNLNPLYRELQKYKKRATVLTVSTCILSVTTLVFGGIVGTALVMTIEQNNNALVKVYDACMSTDLGAISLGDNNSTLTVSESGKLDAYDCVASKLPIPKATQTKIGATTGFSGSQSDSWDGYKATWSYSGSNGLDLVIQKD
ncbi:hypothetical protein CRD60_01075 [Bifidobacterium aemilianum]|uniref:Uncharacterized protein n=1 Tax=Bifidobacterium aemilianum TaxID=2493120 RepID=A0A366KA65_9BIFI|nr:hypothetical protein [Bifidobacterium aemilianum]RBP98489.1 hypothetical protein CRD60_01075 [Bifidobacterium aemilianum]